MPDRDPPDPNAKNRDPAASREKKVDDSGGRSVWKFAVDSGKHFIDSTSSLLRRLDVPGLKIDEEPGLGKTKPAPGGGYDPYGSNRALNPKSTPKPKAYVSRPTAPKPAARPAPEPPPSFIKRLFRRD